MLLMMFFNRYAVEEYDRSIVLVQACQIYDEEEKNFVEDFWILANTLFRFIGRNLKKMSNV